MKAYQEINRKPKVTGNRADTNENVRLRGS